MKSSFPPEFYALLALASRHWKLIALSAYAAIAIATFGRSAAEPQVCFDQHLNKYIEGCPTAGIALRATFAAAAWPLYWSWEAWS